jgi:hypothetical protein
MLSERESGHSTETAIRRSAQWSSDAEREALGRRIDEIMLGRVRHQGMYFQPDSETGSGHQVGYPRSG